eukprot:scaffold171220_cov17-Tisochrysis_lutea.AAC.1
MPAGEGGGQGQGRIQDKRGSRGRCLAEGKGGSGGEEAKAMGGAQKVALKQQPTVNTSARFGWGVGSSWLPTCCLLRVGHVCHEAGILLGAPAHPHS